MSYILKWKKRNPDKVKQYRKTFDSKNKDRIAKWAKAWYKANYDKMKIKQAKLAEEKHIAKTKARPVVIILGRMTPSRERSDRLIK